MSSNGKGDTLATETEHQLLELRLALETVKAERDRYKSTSKIFEKLLTKAEERAERESRREGCVGADAYMLSEDPMSGEVSEPVFLARHGTVPEVEVD